MSEIRSTKTARVAVGPTPVSAYATGDFVRSVRVFANRMIHVAVGGAASATSMPIAEQTAVWINVPSNSTLSVVVADGEPSGFVWVTE